MRTQTGEERSSSCDQPPGGSSDEHHALAPDSESRQEEELESINLRCENKAPRSAVKPHRSLACPPRICVKQYPQKNPPRTSPESILLQWNSSDMDTTQMGMVILAPYSRQVPTNSISIHFLRRVLAAF